VLCASIKARFYNEAGKLTSLLEKRRSLHRHLTSRQDENARLRAEIERLEPPANLGTLTYMIAHELNNLLTPLRNYAELALANMKDVKLVEKALRKTAQNCERAAAVMEGLLGLAKGSPQTVQVISAADLVDGAFACICRDLSKDGIDVRVHVEPQARVRVSAAAVQQALMNLIINARQAMTPGGGILTVRAVEEGRTMRISVADTGPGVEPRVMDRIFEPFFSTKGSAGSGLGLAFCKRVVEAHGGRICVESSPGQGACFTIVLPSA